MSKKDPLRIMSSVDDGLALPDVRPWRMRRLLALYGDGSGAPPIQGCMRTAVASEYDTPHRSPVEDDRPRMIGVL